MGRIFCLMIRRPPRSTRTATLFPCTTLFRAALQTRLGGSPSRQVVPLRVAWRMPAFDRDRALKFRHLIFGDPRHPGPLRSEEHTSELQSLMRISYAVFCLKKKKNSTRHTT